MFIASSFSSNSSFLVLASLFCRLIFDVSSVFFLALLALVVGVVLRTKFLFGVSFIFVFLLIFFEGFRVR